jgi:hypothetical protein
MVAILFFVGLILGFSGCLTYYFVFIRPKLIAITENNDGLRKEREALQNDIYNLNIEFETLSPQVEF